MFDDIKRHPSDVAQSAVEFLEAVDVTQKTKSIYEEVLFLFIESLLSEPSDITETEDGEYLLASSWCDYYGGAISNYIDLWIPTKCIDGDAIQAKAPGVMRKWIKWCYQNNYFDKEHYEDFLEELPRGKSKEVKRLQKAGELLYRLHSPNPGAWMEPEPDRVVSINRLSKPDEYLEGYMTIERLEKDSVYLKDPVNKNIGPVMMSKELIECLRASDVLNVSLGRYGKVWRVLESGNVYAEGMFSFD